MKVSTNGRRGSALLEAPFILLVFMTVLIGTFDIGQLLFLHTSLTERVRNAARYGAINSYDQTAIENMVLYNQPTVPTGVVPAFELTRSMISVTRQSPSTPEDRIVIVVSGYPVHYFTPMIATLSQGLAISACATYELTQ